MAICSATMVHELIFHIRDPSYNPSLLNVFICLHDFFMEEKGKHWNGKRSLQLSAEEVYFS